jgi:hypothetical protein
MAKNNDEYTPPQIGGRHLLTARSRGHRMPPTPSRGALETRKRNYERYLALPQARQYCRGRKLNFFLYRALDFRAAALTDVNHLNQAITKFDWLACLWPVRLLFFCHHPAATAWTDDDRLFCAPRHCNRMDILKGIWERPASSHSLSRLFHKNAEGLLLN